ncbi:molybdopterin-guanine dinucleotide biosynthesis protein A, putative [Deinococcus proteolyticus MRP]|uniref:Molybdopterin-guanine dinucleotide biosynthesis protein A, putative n=1 Tax=Deinococcus proteolyticus (strain ATCC 35074 / DSM 20540 / JCM 6276 / NBRC 101906 / NCIMB 13154 / VKM Ac-1939 / CCM 2703 / MRP) TaxID=693977 RepID=F0RJA7_DEIPM|nr:molybdenum cofactor guanylyltransferase [Deinococcus proteolyticus]ADY26544.1 molybdopterin-guanine dinucleotide biosynthesis protein A, putative [Deinococcus proteolyticus MRP]MCY1702668.1 molybdenum cofactor guanylyltransferase [Deinococcus sp. SL84]
MTGVILAGGQSRRFGSDKALARLGGHTLLERVAASLDSCPQRLLLAPPGRYALPGWTVQAEARAGEGPLAALETALAWAAAQAGPGWVALSGVDYPLLTPAVWQVLAAAAGPGHLAAGFLGGGTDPEPLPALYHTALLPRVTAALDAGERRLRQPWLEEVGVWLDPLAAGLPPGTLADADTPADLAALERG